MTPSNEPVFSKPAGASSRNAEMHWTDYLGILLDRIWIILTLFVVVVAVGYIHTKRQVPYYRSNARIMIEENLPKVMNVEDFFISNTRNMDQFNSHVMALYSRKMMERAIPAMGLDKNPAFMAYVPPGADPAGRALSYVSVEPAPRSRLIDIIVEHPDPKVAALLANGIAEQYIAQNLEWRVSSSMESFEWLKRQSEDYRNKIEEGRNQINEYRREAQMVSLEQHQEMVLAKLKAISGSLTEAESARLAASMEWDRAQAIQKAGQSLSLIGAVAEDNAVKMAEENLAKKDAEVAMMRTRYQAKHPTLVQAMEEQRELKSLHDKAMLWAAARIESAYKAAVEKEAALRGALKEQEREATELEKKLVRYNELKRAVEADQQLYDAVVARMKESKIASDLKANNIRLIDRAEPGGSPVRPIWSRAMLQVVMIGLFLGIAVSMLTYFLDDRLRRVEDMEHALRAPVLSVVTTIPDVEREGHALVVANDAQSIMAESFRTLRASLALRPVSQKVHRFIVTSSISGEGKSLVAANLAIAYARDGQKTLLIDGDMRRPKVNKLFSLPNTLGLSSVLSGTATCGQALQDTPVENLKVITSGPLPKNPAELLGSVAMKRCLDAHGGEFDRIIIDSPPVFGVSDPLTILPLVEGIIFVVQFNKTGRRLAARALDKLREGSTPILGTVFNNVKSGATSAYYYYHRQGYAYGGEKKPSPFKS